MALIITLIVVGLLLIVAEIVLIPGIFVTGILGVASLVYSCIYAFEVFGQTGGIITIAVNIVLAVFFVVLVLCSKTWKKLTLHTNIDSHTDSKPEEKGIHVGQKGVTITRLCPMGKIKIGDQFLEATGTEGIIDPGKEIEISLIDDNKIYVKLI
jgi:membrane-bound ClpP family serine protease